jgi:nucleotide-binding universal stress UspA family protein
MWNRFSTVAMEAVDLAAAMAKRLKTELVLVHVDQLLGTLASNPVLLESATLQRRAELDDEAQRLRDLGTNVKEKFLCGSAFDQLVSVATEVKGRLIVVGAIGARSRETIASRERSRADGRDFANSYLGGAPWGGDLPRGLEASIR